MTVRSGMTVRAGRSAARLQVPAVDHIRFGPDGLVPTVIQDGADGRVLMLAWMDAEALTATATTGEVHFHSRSRDRLWRKGETTGHVLRARDIELDCDGDALLVTVDPVGPTCHRGTRSCFDPSDTPVAPDRSAPAAPPAPAASSASAGFGWLEELWATIADRAATRPTGSYTAALLRGGVDAVGRKVTEEATEVLLAAKDDAVGSTSETQGAIAAETADLLFHALVLLAERGVPPADVIDTLRARHARPPKPREPG